MRRPTERSDRVASVDVIADPGGSFGYLLRSGPRARIGLARGRGSACGSTGAAVAWLLVEGGEGELVIGELHADVGGRDDVFEGPGWSALLGPRQRFAVRGNIRYSIAWRVRSRPATTRLLSPDEVEVERRGSRSDDRLVATYVEEGPLICGETVSEPGCWSTWPPHRHEHEEVCLYRFDPAHGFGVRVLDTKEGDRRADIVREGQARRVRTGHHTVAAAPGARMYSLWALGGETDERVATEFDPRLA